MRFHDSGVSRKVRPVAAALSSVGRDYFKLGLFHSPNKLHNVEAHARIIFPVRGFERVRREREAC
jgi:hypothetical protein